MHTCIDAVILAEGSRAADYILASAHRVALLKALDPLDPRDFVTMTQALAKRLKRAALPPEKDLVKRALQEVDVDWVNLTAAQRSKALDGLNNVLAGLAQKRLKAMPVLHAEAPRIVKGTRTSTIRTYKLGIPKATSFDKKLARSVSAMQSNFITDEAGNIVDNTAAWARDQVGVLSGAGLDSTDIAEQLSKGISARTLGKASNYWNVVAVTFSNRARTWEQMVAYDEAKIVAYLWESVLDKRTTEICRFMHGKRFRVSDALGKFASAEDAAKQGGARGLKDTQPWLTMSRNADNQPTIVTRTSGRTHTLAVVDDAGFGEVDKIGNYSSAASLQTLADLGVSAPPAHGLCRSVTVADV